MTRSLFVVGALVLAMVGVACDDDCERDRDCVRKCEAREPPTPGPTPIPTPVPVTNVFEFRVLGDITGDGVEIRYGTTQEGTSILNSQTPWFVTVRTTQAASFLTLAAKSRGNPDDIDPQLVYLQIQIVVNGVVFREASAVGFEPSVAIAGLYTAP